MVRALAAVAGLAALVAIAGCGGGGAASSERAGPTPKPAPVAPSRDQVDPTAVRVIRGWTDTLRRGDVPGASRYFAVPAVVQNGTEAIRLRTREEVEFFNRTLPCGALLVRSERMGRYTVGVFRLTERPGPGTCGAGAGNEAAVAFLVVRRHITQWRRLLEVPESPGRSV